MVDKDKVSGGDNKHAFGFLVDHVGVAGYLAEDLNFLNVSIVLRRVIFVMQAREDLHEWEVNDSTRFHRWDLVTRVALGDHDAILLVSFRDFPGAISAEVEPLLGLDLALSDNFSLLTSVVSAIHAVFPIRHIIDKQDTLRSGQIFNNRLYCLTAFHFLFDLWNLDGFSDVLSFFDH